MTIPFHDDGDKETFEERVERNMGYLVWVIWAVGFMLIGTHLIIAAILEYT